ncbi:MAG TPA: PAS domain S-box protein [Candidatus Cloacimonadota bacterium]|nr:PAS domain S-box protein [Candidatus Cloacimonadota bacterium]HPK40121.1 PAS domain S-box protein [Candidatus Cloacimonadota bacterium]
MIKRLHLLILFLLAFSCIYSFELNEGEQKLLKNKKAFKILVTDNNYPYEFINYNGEFDGINIDIYKTLFSKLNTKVIFALEGENVSDIDAVSSFSNNQEYREIPTTTLYTVKFYLYSSSSNIDFEKTYNIYMNNLELTQDVLPQLHKNNQYIFSDIELAYYKFKQEKDGLLLVDNLHMPQLDALTKKTEEVFAVNKLENEIEAKLWLKSEDKTSYMVISKVLNEMIYTNEISCIISRWEKSIEEKYLYEKNYSYFLIMVITFFILFLIIVFLLYKQNFIKKDLIVNSYQIINKNKELVVKNQELLGIISQAESQNLSVLDGLSNIAITLDLKGVIKYVNKSVNNILGYNTNTILGTNISSLVSPEDKTRLLRLNPDPTQQGENEIVIKSVEGFFKTFIFTTNFTKSADGETYIHCILQDISERISLDNRLKAYTTHLEDLIKQRMQVLKQSEEQFRYIVEHAYDGIILMQNFTLQLANQAFFQMIKADNSDLTNTNFSFLRIIPDDKLQWFMDKFNQATDNKENSFIITHPIITSSKEIIDVETHFTSINFTGKILDLAIMHNIEEKKAREKEMLEHEKLITVSSFAITANDKINSPLNAIQGYAELLDLQLENKSEVQENAFKNIFDSIAIINRILKRLKSLTNITLKNYNLDNHKMLNIEEEHDNSNSQHFDEITD